MHVSPVNHGFQAVAARTADNVSRLGDTVQRAKTGDGQPELEKVFQRFVGQTFFGQMMQAMRQSVEKPAYFHGGRAEEVFQAQLDQVLAEKMTESTGPSFTGPMFQLYQLNRV